MLATNHSVAPRRWDVECHGQKGVRWVCSRALEAALRPTNITPYVTCLLRVHASTILDYTKAQWENRGQYGVSTSKNVFTSRCTSSIVRGTPGTATWPLPTKDGPCKCIDRGKSVPSWQFQVLLTLFPKCFASFLHSTCSLSISREYSHTVSLGWNLPPATSNFRTDVCFGLHSQAARLWRGGGDRRPSPRHWAHDRALTFSGAPFQATWPNVRKLGTPVNDTPRTTLHLVPCSHDEDGGQFWGWTLPSSLAVTGGILVSFFSSA